MNKSQFIEVLAVDLGVSKVDAALLVDKTFARILTVLKAGDLIVLNDIGVFSLSYHSARTGSNPRNMQPMTIPAVFRVKFKASNKWHVEIN